MSATPFISVVIATRNAATLLPVTLRSLKRQTLPNFEVVLVDGASTDGTLECLREFIDMVSVVISEPDSGIADAWNKGVGRSMGEWITFLNAGDLLHPRHFERVHKALNGRSGEPIVAYCDVIRFNADGSRLRKISGVGPNRSRIRRGGLGFAHPGSITSRRVFDVVGLFPTDFKIAMDTALLLRAFVMNVKFVRFESNAYMADGGLSDRQFLTAIREFFQAALSLGLVTRLERNVLPCGLATLRIVVRLLRAGPVRYCGRQIKHVVIAALNALFDFVPFSSIRRICFTALGARLGSHSSIGLGTRIFRWDKLRMGERSVINRDCLLDSRGGVVIGSNVSIARDVSVFTAGHDVQSPFFEMTSARVVIEDYAVLFARCSVMPGVRIGRAAVVLPGAVVTCDVAEAAIVGGVPAVQVGRRETELLYRLAYTFPSAM